jgi:hypothetical protein
MTNPTWQVVHGLSIPLGKLGFYLPRTLSRGHLSDANSDAPTPPFSLGVRVSNFIGNRSRSRRNSQDTSPSTPNVGETTSVSRPVYRIGGTVIPKTPGSPVSPPRLQTVDGQDPTASGSDPESQGPSAPASPPIGPINRTIRFPDESLTMGQLKADGGEKSH